MVALYQFIFVNCAGVKTFHRTVPRPPTHDYIPIRNEEEKSWDGYAILVAAQFRASSLRYSIIEVWKGHAQIVGKS